MIKSVSYISLALTTFVLVLLVSVVYAYQVLASSGSSVDTQPSSNIQTVALPIVQTLPTNVPDISPQDAASIAAKFSNRQDLYSVEFVDFNGSSTYKVTFSSGDVLYVAVSGQVVGSELPTQSAIASPTTQPLPAVIYTGPVKKHASGNGGENDNSGSSGGGGGEQEGNGD